MNENNMMDSFSERRRQNVSVEFCYKIFIFRWKRTGFDKINVKKVIFNKVINKQRKQLNAL